MATCPQCGNSSRVNPGSMVIEEVLVARPLGTFSLSGSTLKWSANQRLRLRCTQCGFKVCGGLQDGAFVARRSDVEAALRDEGASPGE